MAHPSVTSEHAVDTALRLYSDSATMFDPLRFRVWAEMGLTTAQLRLMFLIRESPGVSAGDLAHRLSVTPPTISGIVDRLVRMGLLQRTEDPDDRRLVRNILTDAGEDACSRLARGIEIYTRRILIEMDHKALEAFVDGLKGFIDASQRVAAAEPDLAAVAMPGTNP
ncbi:MAG: MarR family transcriptional regulator [Dehalococcoidia bacterium]